MNVLPVICSGVLAALVSFTPSQGAPAVRVELEEVNFPPGEYTSIFGINNHGVMVGNYAAVDDPTWSHVWGFIYDGGTFTQVAIGDAPYVSLFQINNRGDSVGEVHYADGTLGTFVRRADGAIEVLPVEGVAHDINDRGTIVGTTFVPGEADRGFVYNRGRLTFYDAPDATYTQVVGTDDRGRMVGRFGTRICSGICQHGFIADGARVTVLDFPGALGTYAWDINNKGGVVGVYFNPDYSAHGFYYFEGRYTTIDFEGSEYGDTWMLGINDHGEIVGTFDYWSWGLYGSLRPAGSKAPPGR